MNVKAPVSKKLRRALAALSVLLSSACNASPPEVPVEVPFGLGKGGESVEFDFKVKRQYGYDVDLKIFFYDKESLNEQKALIKQLGEGIFADGSIGDVGIPISLRVRVQSVDVQGPLVDYTLINDRIPFRNVGAGFASKRAVFRINDQKLYPGIYRIRIDNLHAVPEFANRKINIFVRSSTQGK